MQDLYSHSSVLLQIEIHYYLVVFYSIIINNAFAKRKAAVYCHSAVTHSQVQVAHQVKLCIGIMQFFPVKTSFRHVVPACKLCLSFLRHFNVIVAVLIYNIADLICVRSSEMKYHAVLNHLHPLGDVCVLILLPFYPFSAVESVAVVLQIGLRWVARNGNGSQPTGHWTQV